jgi:1-deoxy-D-xylulose-5-phosphate synthase
MAEDIALLDLRFVKPLDEATLRTLALKHKKWFVFSDSAKMGGVGSALLEFLSEAKIRGVEVTSFEYEDAFITHGNTMLVEASLGLSPQKLAERVKALA